MIRGKSLEEEKKEGRTEGRNGRKETKKGKKGRERRRKKKEERREGGNLVSRRRVHRAGAGPAVFGPTELLRRHLPQPEDVP